MATSKTLTPTNVAIQIPDFTDQPDQRVNSNCIDKEADAINALNSKIANVGEVKQLWVNLAGTTGGEIEMNESIKNFKLLLIKYRTNAEEMSQIVHTDVSYAIYQNINLFGGTGLQTDYSYKSGCFISFTSNTKATVATAYNNGNLILKPISIYGINRK